MDDESNADDKDDQSEQSNQHAEGWSARLRRFLEPVNQTLVAAATFVTALTASAIALKGCAPT